MNRKFGIGFSALFVVLLLTSSIATAQSKLLISVAFKTNNPQGNTPPVSGPEAAATEANPLFSAANVWNNLDLAWGQTTNPAWSSLVDSTGAPTGARLSISGTVIAVDFWPWAAYTDPLRSSLIGWNSWINGGGASGPGESTSLIWTLTGLPHSSTFDICVYGSFADMNRSFDMTIQGNTLSVPTFNSFSSPAPATCVLFTNVTSDGHGTISGLAAGTGDGLDASNEANWSGFQIVEVAKGKGRKNGLHKAKNH
jgi:hypothetical protein